MIRSRIRMIGLALVAGFALTGCQERLQGAVLSSTSADGWKQIAEGTGKVIGDTKYDPKIAASADKVYAYCNVMRPVATGATIFSPEKAQKAAQIARSVVTTICDQQPRSVKEALVTAAAAYAEIMLLLAAPPAPS